jgi:hypothetical protein
MPFNLKELDLPFEKAPTTTLESLSEIKTRPRLGTSLANFTTSLLKARAS